jgi:hypothetical protein
MIAPGIFSGRSDHHPDILRRITHSNPPIWEGDAR